MTDNNEIVRYLGVPLRERRRYADELLNPTPPGYTPPVGVTSTGAPTPVVTPFGQAVGRAAADAVMLPGRVLQGERQVFDPATGHVSDEAVHWATDRALNRMLPQRVAAAPGEQVLGAAPIRPSLFDRTRLGEVPDVAQFDLPRNTPARGVPQRVQDVTNDPGVRDRMLGVIQEGVERRGPEWYNAEPLRQQFVSELGADRGQEAFRKYMDFVAATSPRSDVGTNVRNASFYYQKWMKGEPMPAVGDRNPAPYGHMAQRLHQMNAERVAGPGWDPLNNPKPASFVENLVGNQTPATIDTHAFRLPAILAQDPRFLETAYQTAKDAPKQNIQAAVTSGQMSIDEALRTPAYWQAQPKANEYGAMERYYGSLGRELGLTPAQTQASAWVGGGRLTGLASDESKPFLGFLEDRIHLTAEKTGRSPQEVMREFIRGNGRLLALPAAAGAAYSYPLERLGQ